jgi:hypothetical protein
MRPQPSDREVYGGCKFEKQWANNIHIYLLNLNSNAILEDPTPCAFSYTTFYV